MIPVTVLQEYYKKHRNHMLCGGVYSKWGVCMCARVYIWREGELGKVKKMGRAANKRLIGKGKEAS